MTWDQVPEGSGYQVGALFYQGLSNQTFIPIAPGKYVLKVTYNDGCGEDFSAIYLTENVPCPDFWEQWSLNVLPSSTTIMADVFGKQTVRMDVAPGSSPLPIEYRDILPSWEIVSAPVDSVYYPYTNVTLFKTVTTTTAMVLPRNGNVTQTIITNSTTQWYNQTKHSVYLELSPTETMPNIFPVCFRPDIGGEYRASLTLSIAAAPLCQKRITSTVLVTCPSTPDLSSVTDMTVQVDRQQPTRVWLNASSVPDPAKNMTFSWKVLYPTVNSQSTVNGHTLQIPKIISPNSRTASFFVPESNIDYIVQLSVTDYCSTTVKSIIIHTLCKTVIPLANKTLATTFSGEIPVNMMSFAYDHTVEIANFLSFPKCQHYAWSLADYSTQYSDSLISGSTEFAKTSGFAALISIVVIIAVIVPIVVWLYVTKKACFKSTDPRV